MTKGERWYVFTFSIPDLEIRQGKRYDLSFDLKAEYDKFLNYSFYGLGGNVFCDTGTVWPSLGGIDLGNIAFDAGVGLRFTMPDFVVRVDVA